MRITKKVVFQMNDDGSFTELERDSYDYDGPVAECFGGGSKTSSQTTTTTDIDTTQVGIESVGDGIGIASTGDVSFRQDVTLTDQGAVDSAFEFAGEFGGDALDFASSVSRQAGDVANRAVDVSRQAIATVATGGQSDIQQSNVKAIGFIAAGLAAVFLIPKLIKG